MSIVKNTVNDFAMFGGTPAFSEKLHVGRPNIGDRRRLMERINEMLDRRWLTNNGPFVQEFERCIAGQLGVRHCIAMCNATIALEIVVRALGMKGEVIVPSFTFVATAHALQWQEITPVFCDIDPETHTIDPACVERLITPRTTGIIGVHLWSRPCKIEALQHIAEQHGLHLIFDAAHAFGCTYGGQAIGSFGEAEVFSFHATKFFNTCEGGAVVTNNDVLAAKLRLMKNFGFCGFDNVIHVGTNGKMSEMCAAVGLTNLEHMPAVVSANRRNYERYRDNLRQLPGIRLATYNEQERNNYQYIVLEIDEAEAHIARDTLLAVLHAENVIARRYFFPGCHRMEPYRSYFPNAHLLLPNTERIAAQVLVLPTGECITEEQIDIICDIVRQALAHGAAVETRMRKLQNHTAATTRV